MRSILPALIVALVPFAVAAAGRAPASAAKAPRLVSTSIDLPGDEALYPDGPHVDVVNENCIACHSSSMVLTQPRMNADQWKAIVEKMRDTYKAPVPAAAIPDIVAYLAATSAK